MSNLCFVFQTGQHDCCCTCRIYARCGSCPHELFTRWRLGDQRVVVARMAQLVGRMLLLTSPRPTRVSGKKSLSAKFRGGRLGLRLPRFRRGFSEPGIANASNKKTVSSSFRGSTKIRTCWGSPTQQKPGAWHVRKPWEMRRGCLGRASSSSCRRCTA
eukprot:s7739_g4.t1